MREKRKTILVKCMIVDSDGFPVEQEGEPIGVRQKPWYEWELRRMTERWMKENPLIWKPLASRAAAKKARKPE